MKKLSLLGLMAPPPLTLALLSGLALFASANVASAQKVYLVDDSSPATSPTGLVSWSQAFQDPQQALSAAQPNDTILIAEGTYSPDISNPDSLVGLDSAGVTPDGRFYSFVFKKPTKVIGGFKGYGDSGSGTMDPDYPDGDPALTILEGDVYGTPTDIRDNSHHVVHIDGDLNSSFQTSLTKIQRLVIRLGYAFPATNIETAKRGAGIYCKEALLSLEDVTVSNCWAQDSGGGIYSIEGNLQTRTCIIRDNFCLNFGGGIHMLFGHDIPGLTYNGYRLLTQIHNTQILNNSSRAGGGLGLIGPFPGWGSHDGVSVANSLIAGNRAQVGGGAFIYMGDPEASNADEFANEWVNCTFAHNEAAGDPSQDEVDGQGGGLIVLFSNDTTTQASSPYFSLTNSILKFNTGRSAPSVSSPSNLAVVVLSSLFPAIAQTVSLDPGSITHCDIGPHPIYSTATIPNLQPSTLDWAASLTNVIDMDPGFENSVSSDYYLKQSSPCRDVGHDGEITHDYRDIDDDGNRLERLPLDIDRFLNGDTRVREWSPATPETTPGITGVDLTPVGIIDLGCYEWKPFER